MNNQLEQLKKMTVVVADTGDIESIKLYQPIDATTNPSLVYKAALLDQYQSLLESTVKETITTNTFDETNVRTVATNFSVALGLKILKIIPGKISTEVDSRLSFDTHGTVEQARNIIQLYKKGGVDKGRILIKIAATWEGIQAARELQEDGINCNITLVFNFHQALAAAQASAFLISPFVGRILDWYKKSEGREYYSASEDPGVVSVTNIYNHFRKNNITTIVMGASFRNVGEIQELAGCDYLTINPDLMAILQADDFKLERKLSPEYDGANIYENITVSEKVFRWQLNQDPMASEKLSEGIRGFTVDQEKLEALILEKFS